MVIVREAGNTLIRIRDEWQRRRSEGNPEAELLVPAAEHQESADESEVGPAPPRQPAGVTYREWFCRLPADPSVLELQRQWFEEWTRPLKVWGLVVDDGGDVAATEMSLQNQSWGLVEVVKVEVGGLADEFDRLSQQFPGIWWWLRAGDQLRPDAVFKMAQVAWRDPWLELVYWDDDRAELAEVWDWHLAGMPEGVYFDDDLDRLSQPGLKPGWSPELLTCSNYIGRAFAVRARSLQAEVARRYRDAGIEDDTLWWDLLLSLDVAEQLVCRLPAVLQAADRREERPESHHLEMVTRWLSRQGWPARAEAGASGVNPAWTPDPDASVSIIIATRHNRELLEGAFDLIRSANHPSAELIVVDNGGRSNDNEAWYQARAADLNPQIIWWDKPFNYSAVNNRAAAQATGEVLVFLNDDTSSGHPGWLHNLVGWAQRPEIGVAGLQLIDDDGLIQHGGVIIGMTGLAGHLFQGMAPHSDTLMGSTDWTRNTVAVTGACLAVRRSVFEEVGGFDERLELCGSDVVLGLRARQGRIPQCGLCGHPRRTQGVGHQRPEHPRRRCFRQLLGLPALADGRRPLFLSKSRRIPVGADGALRGEAGCIEAAHRDAGSAYGDLLSAKRVRGGPRAVSRLRGRSGARRVGSREGTARCRAGVK